jgi:hypothetical protein
VKIGATAMNDQSHHDSKLAGHEPIEANVRAVWITGGVLASIVAGTFLVILGLMAWLEATPDPQEMQAGNEAEAKTDPDWNVPPHVQQLRTKEQQFLNTYQWVDQMAGVARIPLDRAFEIITETGLPEAIGVDASPANQTTNDDE